ncbi:MULTISPECIES: hypothetical protein [Butyricimonas]|uniref:hypothetical protein n=1 Tax=Butyricimonas TaxID=574697 RepID=UPI0007FB3748|nr:MULTISPECIES: hypothetical protein [Butyricimonas]
MQTQNNITGAEFLSDLNVLLSTSVGLNRNVKQALRKLGEHEKADQVYIVSINHDMTFTITEEWTRNGDSVFPETDEKRSFYYDRKLEQDLERDNYIYIRDIEEVTNEGLKNIMRAMQVRCAIFLPLYVSSHLFSFLSLSRCGEQELWSEEDIAFLIQVASVMSGALEKELILRKLVKHHALYQDFIENRVDYILRLNRHLHISFSNKTFYSLFGDSPDDVIGCRIGDLMTEMDIPPKQLEAVAKHPDMLLTFHSTLAPADEVIFIEWYAYPVKLDREHIEIHLIGHNVTRFREVENELNVLKTDLQVFSESMFPMWKSICERVQNDTGNESGEEKDDLMKKTEIFNRFYEELLSKIGYKFAAHAYRS